MNTASTAQTAQTIHIATQRSNTRRSGFRAQPNDKQTRTFHRSLQLDLTCIHLREMNQLSQRQHMANSRFVVEICAHLRPPSRGWNSLPMPTKFYLRRHQADGPFEICLVQLLGLLDSFRNIWMLPIQSKSQSGNQMSSGATPGYIPYS